MDSTEYPANSSRSKLIAITDICPAFRYADHLFLRHFGDHRATGVAGAVKRHRNHVLEDLSLTALKEALPAIWVVHSFSTDYGIDVQIEIFEDNGNSTGLRVYGQLKATDKSQDEDVLQLDRDHFEYWSQHTDPVALFRYYAGSGVIKWCWMHDLEWRMRPSANSMDVSSHLSPWHELHSSSAIFRLAQLRADALHQKLPPPISISVRSVRGGMAESLKFAGCLAERFPARLFEVLGEPASHCHFDVILDDGRLCIGHLGLPGYVATIEDESLTDEITDLALLLIFLIAVRYERTPVFRGVATKVLGNMWSVADGPLLALAIEGLMATLGIDRVVPRILEHAPHPEDPELWFSLITAGTRASHRYGETESWSRQLKSWADMPPYPEMAATAAYNYANHVANSGLAQWEKAEEYYLLAGLRDSSYHDRAYYWSELGAAQFEAWKYDAAVVSYQRSLEISPSAETLWRLGDAMFHGGSYEAAYATIAEAVSSGEDLGTYPLLVMEVCSELMSRWHINKQTVASINSEIQEQLMAQKPVATERDLVASLQPFMNICAVDPLLAFNSGRHSITSKQAQVATYRFLTCALRQRHDAEAWALALAAAFQADLGELFALIAESAYFYTGEDLMPPLMRAFSFPAEVPLDATTHIRQQLIDLIRLTKVKEPRSFTMRIYGGDREKEIHGAID